MGELIEEHESKIKSTGSLADKLVKIQSAIKSLNEEILDTLKIINGIRGENREIFEQLEEHVKEGDAVYPYFKDLENSRDKAHIKRCIEITETKLRRLRGEL